MFTITIVRLTVPQAMAAGSVSALENADKLFLQTDRHPLAKVVTALGKPYVAMDDLYADAEDFDALNNSIAARLVAAGECVYAATGSVMNSQLPAIDVLAKANGGAVCVLPAVSLSSAAFPELPEARALPACELPERFDVTVPIVMDEIDNAILAGGVKLALGEYYPDDWPVWICALTADDVYRRREIPLYELDRQTRYDATTAIYVPPVPFEALTRYGYDELSDVVRRLRAPNGCPWDREQTHATLKVPLLEECYELLDAIDSGDDAHICEELGDVLLQVAMHARIAAEQGRFTERDVQTGLVRKLIYRHPHIFGSARADTADEVLANWDKLKKAEKAQRTHTDVLRSVPRNLPSLTRAYKVQKKAANAGFDWPDAREALPKIAEEADEALRALNGDGDIEEEMGDLLFSVVNVARLLNVDPELALRAAADKFVERFGKMESLARVSGKKLEEMTLSDMDLLWNTAKPPKESKKI